MSQRDYSQAARSNSETVGSGGLYIRPANKEGHFSIYKKGADGQAMTLDVSSLTMYLDSAALEFSDGNETQKIAPCWELVLGVTIPATVGTRLADFASSEDNGIPIVTGKLVIRGDRGSAIRAFLNVILGTINSKEETWNDLISAWYSPKKVGTGYNLFVKTNTTAKKQSPQQWPWDADAKVFVGLPPVKGTGVYDGNGMEVMDSKEQMNALLEASKQLVALKGGVAPNIPPVVKSYKQDGVTKASIFGTSPQPQAPAQTAQATQPAAQATTSINEQSYINTFKARFDAGGMMSTDAAIQLANSLILAASKKVAEVLPAEQAIDLCKRLFETGTDFSKRYQATMWDSALGKYISAAGSEDLPF